MLTIKQIEIVVQDSYKPTGILGKKIEGENTMEKCLRVFCAHSGIFLWRSKVIALLNRCVRLNVTLHMNSPMLCEDQISSRFLSSDLSSGKS